MCTGDIVFLPTNGGYLKYIIKKIIDDELIVKSIKSNKLNWLTKSDVLTLDEFKNKYNNEEIFE